MRLFQSILIGICQKNSSHPPTPSYFQMSHQIVHCRSMSVRLYSIVQSCHPSRTLNTINTRQSTMPAIALSIQIGTPSFDLRCATCVLAWAPFCNCAALVGFGGMACGCGILAVGCATPCAGLAAGYEFVDADESATDSTVLTKPSASSASVSPPLSFSFSFPISSFQPIFSSFGISTSSAFPSFSFDASSHSLMISPLLLAQIEHLQFELSFALLSLSATLDSSPPS